MIVVFDLGKMIKKISNTDWNVRNRVRLLLAITFFILSACQGQGIYRGYSGKALPQTEVAHLLVPDKFNLLYIDDQHYEAPVLTHGARLELIPGKHRLVVEYDEMWDISIDDHERVKSLAVLLEFIIRPGRRYKLQSRQLKDIGDARDYAKRPELGIVELSSSQSVPVRQEYRLHDKNYMAGFAVDDSKSDGHKKNVQASRMLEYWWRQSDPGQQQAFLNWVKSHSKFNKE